MNEGRSPFSIRHEITEDGTLTLSIGGSLSMRDGSQPFVEVEKTLSASSFQRINLDLSGVHEMDSAAIALVVSLMRWSRDHEAEFAFEGGGSEISGLMAMLDMESLVAERDLGKRPRRPGFVVRVGEATLQFLANVRYILVFVGELVLAIGATLRNPRKLRWNDFYAGVEINGVNALPIIVLINLLVGIVLAFQAAIQLKQFGANIFVADLVGLAQTREFGPMITAVLLAGRSGSAFAAEIGSMRVREEVDALQTMGLEPVRFLVVPKVLALLVCLPALTLFADVVGIAGGLLVGVTGLDLTVQGYLIQTQKAVGVFDVFSGILKTFAFALIIAGIGCLRGFQVRGGADSVGHAATSAVVSGIFLIILVDAIFTVIFQYV